MRSDSEKQQEIRRNTGLRIYLGHGNDSNRKVIEATLELLSHTVELSTSSPETLLDRCIENPPDVAIVGTDFQHASVFQTANELSDKASCPVVALIRRDDVDRAQRLMGDDVMGVLVQPVSEDDLRPAIYLARRRYQQSCDLQRQARRLKQEIEALGQTENN